MSVNVGASLPGSHVNKTGSGGETPNPTGTGPERPQSTIRARVDGLPQIGVGPQRKPIGESPGRVEDDPRFFQ
ncbi:hypothetical protein OKW29_000159 [Paraburkholderia sp. CI3]